MGGLEGCLANSVVEEREMGRARGLVEEAVPRERTGVEADLRSFCVKSDSNI